MYVIETCEPLCVYFLDMWYVCSEYKTCVTLYGCFHAHACGLGRLVISVYMCTCQYLFVRMCASALWVVCVY